MTVSRYTVFTFVTWSWFPCALGFVGSALVPFSVTEARHRKGRQEYSTAKNKGVDVLTCLGRLGSCAQAAYVILYCNTVLHGESLFDWSSRATATQARTQRRTVGAAEL